MLENLDAMEEMYLTNKMPDVRATIVDMSSISSYKQVISPIVVRGKGRPVSLRNVSRIEKTIQKMRKTKNNAILIDTVSN